MASTEAILAAKGNGAALSAAQIGGFVADCARGEVAQAQIGAFLMAVTINGMDLDECTALTRAMRDSGRVIDWSALNLPGPVVDKHSTGGVGDKVSLILGPLLAACGACVPMISGRGLGHTGGTLDKLESLPGYRCALPVSQLQRVVARTGVAIVGQSAELAPADGVFYRLRDITGTVASLPLIVSSILSKKLAAGLGALVMDVKLGAGATLPAPAAARELGEWLEAVGAAAGCPTQVQYSDMGQVLGDTAGNALELAEAITCLRGEGGDHRLIALVMALGERALRAVGLAASAAQARAQLRTALHSGAAAERFERMVAALGGPPDALAARLPRAPLVAPVQPSRDGVVGAHAVRAIGELIVDLGGGRRRPGDRVDHAVGLSALAAPGQTVGAGPQGRPLALLHARDRAGWQRAAAALRRAVEIAPPSARPRPRPVLCDPP